MLQGEANIVQSFQQTVALKFTNFEGSRKTMVVGNCLVLKIHGEAILALVCATHQLTHIFSLQLHRQQTIFHAIVGKDVGKRWRDDRAKAVIGQRPGGVFARGTATEIFSGDQD